MIERQPRMIWSDEGPTSTGKTYKALKGVPRPVLLLDSDYGAEGLPAEVLEGVDLIQYDLLAGAFKGESDASRKQMVKAEVERMLADLRRTFDDGKYRTVVVDTASVLWTGLRMCHESWDEAQEVMFSLIRAAYKSTVNLTLLHHMETAWARTADGKSYKKPGTWERIGMPNIENKVQLATSSRWVPAVRADGATISEGRFETTILKCRDNKALEGETLDGLDWQTLCSLAAPSVDWGK